MKVISNYFKDSFEEFRKVTWPTKEQTALLTAITVGVSVAFILLIGAVDLGFSELLTLLRNG